MSARRKKETSGKKKREIFENWTDEKKSIQTNKKSTGIELNKNIERCTNKKNKRV